jgi:hypothetical protein
MRAMKHELGLEAYRLPFAVAAPRHHSGSSSSWAAAAAAAGTANATDEDTADGTAAPLACETVAGVLRSPRGDGKECLVLVTPINMQAFAPPGALCVVVDVCCRVLAPCVCVRVL